MKTEGVRRAARGRRARAATRSATELQEFVKARLAKHKYPRIVEFVDDVPKNDRGKVDRKALRARERARERDAMTRARDARLAELTTDEVARARRAAADGGARAGGERRAARAAPAARRPTRSSARTRPRARARRAARRRGSRRVVAPSVPYGVTDFAEGFAGRGRASRRRCSRRSSRAIAQRFLADGWSHVCLVNNHLEPAHDAAVRARRRRARRGARRSRAR